jgi:NhaP-type Na+/H+ or K+/H+ antiporter
MVMTLVLLVIALFVFGGSFAVTGSLLASVLLTAGIGLAIGLQVAWIRRRPLRWSASTRVRVVLGFALFSAALGVAEILVERRAGAGNGALTTAALAALTAAFMHESGRAGTR